jgi:hypothetical protein
MMGLPNPPALAPIVGCALLFGCGGHEGESSFEDPGSRATGRRPVTNFVQDAFDGGAVYTAALPEADATLAVIVGPAGRVDGYVCGNSTYETHSTWICGETDTGRVEGPVSVENESGWTFAAVVELDAVRGSVSPPGEAPIEFIAARAAEHSYTNIYENGDVGCRTGVIAIEEPGRVPRLAGTWCAPGGFYGQVTPLEPVDLSANNLQVVAHTPFGPTVLTVTPLLP